MSAPNFEIEENDSGVRIKVRGETLGQLFSNAVRGSACFLNPEIVRLKKRELNERHNIKVEAVDLSSLLVEFLSEVVAQSDLRGAVFSVLEIEKLGDNFLEGKIFGKKVSDSDRVIKEVLYDEADIRKNPETGLYETLLVFEV